MDGCPIDRSGRRADTSGMDRSDIEAAAKRLCRLATRIDDATWRAGDAWYAHEADWIVRRAADHGADPRNAVAAYAALSPRLRLNQNRAALIAVLRGERPRGVFSRSVAAARLALADGPETLTGPKVRSFCANLLGDGSAVTVDVWAARAARLDVPTTAKRYAAVAAAYRLAAGRIGRDPRTLQAATWLHVRGIKPSDHDNPTGWEVA